MSLNSLLFYSGGDLDKGFFSGLVGRGGTRHLPDVVANASDFLHRGSFFIFDDSRGMGEEIEDPHEMVMFFYPENVDKDAQLFLVGCVLSLRAFVANFSNQTMDIITMDQSKLVFLKQGTHTIVLSGSAEVPDTSLKEHLDIILRAFKFFNGSFDDIQLRCEGNEAAFREQIQRAGKELLPLIKDGPAVQPLISFGADIIPYFELPPNYNRLFISANQILTSVCGASSDNFGGCLLANNAIICSQLELGTTTRFILALVEYLRGAQKLTDADEGTGEQEAFHQVLVDDVELEKLRDTRVLPVPAPSIHDLATTTVSSATYVGLYVLTRGKISLAVIMHLSLLHDVRHIKTLRLLATHPLSVLESKLDATDTSEKYSGDAQWISHDIALHRVREKRVHDSQLATAFLRSCRDARDAMRSEGASEVLYRDGIGYLYSRGAFATESYVHCKANEKKIADDENELVRTVKVAREVLTKENMSLY